MADTILTQTFVILFFMGIGLASGRFGCLKEEAQKWLASFVMTLSLPAAILLSAEGPLTPERSTGVFWMQMCIRDRRAGAARWQIPEAHKVPLPGVFRRQGNTGTLLGQRKYR